MMMTHDVKLMSILNSYMMNGKGINFCGESTNNFVIATIRSTRRTLSIDFPLPFII